MIDPAHLAAPTETVAGLMFIGAIGGLANMKSADLGVKLGMAGMAGALTTTYIGMTDGYAPIGGALLGAGG